MINYSIVYAELTESFLFYLNYVIKVRTSPFFGFYLLVSVLKMLKCLYMESSQHFWYSFYKLMSG